MSQVKPRLMLIGGPDVDSRLELMTCLASQFELAAVGSEPRLAKRFRGRYPYFDYPLARGFDLPADRRSMSALSPLISHWAPAIVHCFDTKPCVVGRLAARRAKVPAVIGTLPGLGALYTYDTPSIRQRREVFRRLHTLACHRSGLTLFYNAEDRQIFVERKIVSPRQCRVIAGSGVLASRFARLAERPEYRAEARRKLGLAAGEQMVLTVARLIRSKGALDLASAATAIRDAHPDCRIWWAGGQDKEALDALDSADLAILGQQLEWLGPRDDIEDLLAAADVFVFPSYYREGIPRALIEAAFAGLPIVTTDHVGCREVVANRRSGLLVPTRQPSQLAQAVVDLLRDRPAAKRYGRRARQLALERFELGKIAHQLSEIYRELLP